MKATQAHTPCNQETFAFQDLGSRKVQVDFSGGYLSSDGGGLLLREVDQKLGFCQRLAKCFSDHRDARFVEHPLPQLLSQRIHGLALGYEDLNDQDELRHDPVFAATCGRDDLLGRERLHDEDKGKALAGKSTLNRLELGSNEINKEKKIQPHPEKLRDFLIEEGVKRIPRKSRSIIIDFDATDDPLHGQQEGAFYHGYYGHYCYLPLYAFCGDIPLWAELRKADIDGAKGTLEAFKLIVAQIRKRFGKKAGIILRADGGFCRDELLTWIEAQPKVYYVVGLPKNARLEKLLEPTYKDLLTDEWGYNEFQKHNEQVSEAKKHNENAPKHDKVTVPGYPKDLTIRRYTELRYRTKDSWSCERRVIGKASLTRGKINSRFIVTNLTGEEDWIEGDESYLSVRGLYEEVYCARGDMENRIKEQQMDLFGDRTSTGKIASNQLRLHFSTFAYMLLRDLRAEALAGTRYQKATVGQIRLHLLKIAAHLTVSVRRIHIRLTSACPSAGDFAKAHANLASLTAFG